ncbi:hypothetical protein [Bradyrhizobium japonicum]|uniref:hypothetical protein n=1 Tax=Bradyrhizobium japonicum TaxID=375 RepID=UPI0027147756|nr:hypothetical protein [Bradyrhizobium japonicum]WLB24301.1 hypothetical protein QIH95_48015 [Bradyrhizobium japonicum]
MKLAETRSYANPKAAARKLVELATGVEPVQDGRIHIEKDQRAIPVHAQGKKQRVRADPKFAVERGWLELRESGTYVRTLAQGIDLFPRQ